MLALPFFVEDLCCLFQKAYDFVNYKEEHFLFFVSEDDELVRLFEAQDELIPGSVILLVRQMFFNRREKEIVDEAVGSPLLDVFADPFNEVSELPVVL